MEDFIKKIKTVGFLACAISFVSLISCNDDDTEDILPTGNSKEYDLAPVADPSISGTVTFSELSDGSVEIDISLTGTPAGGIHPSHIHANTAVEGGGIVLSLEPVDGSTGSSTSIVTNLDDGTPISYDELLDFDGYVNVHLSAENLATIVAQGDIGRNDLTGDSKVYSLAEKDVEGISGSATFFERLSGESLAVISLENTPEGGTHPTHIHANTAVEGGAILFTFSPVDGTSGLSQTNVASLDDGTTVTYQDLLTIDGYINVHLASDQLSTIVAQGDIGQNELTGESKIYNLDEKDVEGISGTATFFERISGESLAVISLENTPEGGIHPTHIHANSAAEGGGILFTFSPVDGTSGLSESNVSTLDDSTPITYQDLLTIDGYINVHLASDQLATIVAQGDIGQNELTGESIVYNLDEKDVAGISGTATFFERLSGESLAVISLVNTPEGGSHPAHIHANSAAEGGGIIFTFNPVDGTTGESVTHVDMLDDGTALLYNDVLSIDGYINVHLAMDQLATIVAQGNIGINAAAGGRISYDVTNSGASAYIFNGNGLTNSSNPDLTLQRGLTYVFNVNTPGHPFLIKTTETTGTANTYSSGVTANGATNGEITFVVPSDAPDELFYNCEFHSSMSGKLTITN